jgi:hypothetical protein
VILGETLYRYLLTRERREFFHPEIQAEMEFGLDQSKKASPEELLAYVDDFLKQDEAWDDADDAIVNLRAGMIQKDLPAARELASTVEHELAYQYAMWSGDYSNALAHCRTVLSRILHPDLRGYRALWLYLAGSAASLATDYGHLAGKDVASNYFGEAQKAAPSLRWLVNLRHDIEKDTLGAPATDDKVYALVERLESVLETLGTTHDRKYDAEEARILEFLLQDGDGKLFEQGHERLGRMLGFEAGNSEDDGAPDPWWIVDADLCFVFEDYAEAKSGAVLGATKARQAASHPNWIREKLKFHPTAEIIPVLVTPTSEATSGARPHLKTVRYWNLKDFRRWAKSALQTMREIRRFYPGPANIGWRADAAKRLRTAKIGPVEFNAMLNRTAYDAMSEAESTDAEG